MTAASRVAAMALLLLALAGCLEVKAGLQVNSDDTVSGQLTLLAPQSELTTGGRTKEQGFANYRAQLPPLPEGSEAPFDDGTNYGVIVTYDHTPLAKFNGNMKIVRAGNQYVMTIGLDPTVIAGQIPNGNPETTRSLLTTTAFEITVTMPGNIVSSQTNGTVIGQSNVIWNLAGGTVKPTQLKAVSQVSAGATSSAPVVAGGKSSGPGALVLAVIAAVVLLVLMIGVLVTVLVLRGRHEPTPPSGPEQSTPLFPGG